jgi:hypothetical protein
MPTVDDRACRVAKLRSGQNGRVLPPGNRKTAFFRRRQMSASVVGFAALSCH